ncbi:Serine racemase [Hibiscus syriacus]|uniref:Serine racemase n=1 Tax=Hibiscus syriacus TaxID=106335 RepID=A0A6A2XMW1_HIBSY|nr:Serine racemase [Hibiscus syriacus]
MEVNKEKYSAYLLCQTSTCTYHFFVHRTPVMTLESLDAISGRKLFFKCECFRKGSKCAAQSKATGTTVTLLETNMVADGLRAFLGELTWPVVHDLVDGIITVDDTEIIDAMRLCYEILKVAVEPSGAIGLAAVLSDSFRRNPAWKDCNQIGIILLGGNLDLEVLWIHFENVVLEFSILRNPLKCFPSLKPVKNNRTTVDRTIALEPS